MYINLKIKCIWKEEDEEEQINCESIIGWFLFKGKSNKKFDEGDISNMDSPHVLDPYDYAYLALISINH